MIRITSPQQSHSRSSLFPSWRNTLLAACSALFSIHAGAQAISTYAQTNIISDGSVPAAQVDATLTDPWGVSNTGQGLWINAAGSGFSLVESIAGTKAFAVAVPPAAAGSGHGSPSGTVYNSNTAIFPIPSSGSALVLFGTLDGTIAGWNPSTPQAVTVVNNSASHAVYTDIALDTNATGTFLLAADFSLGTIDVFDSNFAPAHLAGSFADPQLPKGYAPFGVHSIGSNIYVAYAEVNPSNGFETLGAGLGYVDVFDNNGNLVQRAISQGALNAPWGMALAPASFGSFGGDILVGNFGDGVINAYDPTTFALVGPLQSSPGTSIANPGLWEIFFGSNGVGDPNTLYFVAGLNGGRNGLFGSIALVSVAGTPSFSVTPSATSISIANGQTGSLTLSLTGSNGFSGPVTFSCSGLPSGDSCTFSPSTVSLSGGAAASVTANIAAAAVSAPPSGGGGYSAGHASLLTGAGLTLAFIAPFGMFAFAGVRRRSAAMRGTLLILALGVVSAMVTGCSNSAQQQQAVTPVTSSFNINATSGAVTQTITVSLTTM